MKYLGVSILMLISAGQSAAWAQDTTRSVKELKEVAVTAQKQVVEFKPDKIVYNVAASVNATGSNALELLRRSPGVTIDNNNNISLNGKSGVNIYIDGKPAYVQGDAIAAMLKSLQSAGISSIELIANPGSKYDAAGAGGIINIRLKKLTATGYNGDISAGFHYGTSPKTEAALILNYRTKNYNVYANYNHYFGYNNMHYDYYRVQNGQVFDTRTKDTDKRNPINFKTGIDITTGKKSTIGLMLNGNLYFGPGLTNTTTYIPDVQQTLIAKNDYYSQRQNWMNYNTNYQYKDGDKRSFSTDLDYGHYHAMIKNLLSTNTTPAQRNLSGSDIDVYGVKSDYEQALWAGRLSAGIKGSFIKSGNNVRAYDVSDDNNTEKLSDSRSNVFHYNENIYAAYGSYEKQLGNLKMQLGLRLEQTDAHGNLDTQLVRNKYLDVFPNASFTYKTFTLSYGKRIERPSYAELNPFEYMLDALSYWKGNAFLQPQYIHNISLTYTATGIGAATLSYSRIKNFSAQITDTVQSNKIVMIPENLGTQDLLNLNIAMSQSVTDWWQFTFNGNVYYRANHVTLSAYKNMQLQATAFNINLQQTFNIGKKTKAEISGIYNSNSIWGTAKSKYMWTVDLGVQRTILKDKAHVRLAVSDIFKTYRWYSIQQFDGFYMSNMGGRDSRQIKMSFGYRFGNNKISSERHSSGLEQESQRIK
jgi:iron complex outermembrane receptor protein